MVKLNKIYTRTGDDGTTGLVGGSRIAKSAPLMAAIGDVDEANSWVGLAAVALDEAPDAAAMLTRIQNELFDLGADLATPPDAERGFGPHDMALRIVPGQIARLEEEIDAMNAALDALKSFILPGGSEAAARLHLARAVTRRAERSAVAAAADRALNPLALTYLNRLSDHLFVLARSINGAAGGDVLWKPGATR
ncbi:cob(I)yrinic acid a,c-diamide adenosyltransferase [Sphingopyxis alaskensis]|jgi:cob(I)alamin adenosyltransferase|uniref:Corrinoid adenosyltransferase n=1 Tax=Sphingopyxis alaskensis (strain DSM 13593 / LMG 18877 / RB2256) TaxID=317655 RepID=Q1GNI2_SPHAL|nr:cob(I)yrinic acid a,c-diamide adenosyltransferase [Sphingopyxis alaskensis]ABF54790.1 ATP:cob(I)alamin adenosyltransferase [Sphingopyxis alaskensis RB2256]MCM3418370.1 cob(I)yrinic acid a,c-diamide adenosyltransferase [Sphingopyxis alaskensis]